jgi:Tfp pilus assembly protein PilO
MTLTDRDRKIVIVLLPIVLIVAYWFLLLTPKREAAARASDELAKQEQRRDAARQAVDAAKGAETNFASDYAEIVRLGKAIPATVDMPSLLVQLDAAAQGTGIRFTKIATGERQVTATTTTTTTPPATGATPATPAAGGTTPAQSAPGAAAQSATTAQQSANQQATAAQSTGVAPSDTQTSTPTGGGLPVGGGTTAAGAPTAPGTAPVGLETVPLEMEFVGDFFNLADFFHRVKRFVRIINQDVVVSGRLVTVEGVRWSSDPELFPRIKAELTATIYLSPKVEGTTAGATPQGPSTTTPAGTPPATTPTTPSAPTATAIP